MRRLIRMLVFSFFLAIAAMIALSLAPAASLLQWRDRAAGLLEPYAPGLAASIRNWTPPIIEPPIPPLPPVPDFRATPLAERLKQAGFVQGQPVFIRILKRESLLELFMDDGKGFRLFWRYPICAWSGALGPKKKEGDFQSPEGFYSVTPAAMNPNSSYHLSFNLGFPNAYDRAHGRTGSFLMVHGACLSAGCYAMTNEGIDEIYGLVGAAHSKGQAQIAIHALPFRLTEDALAREKDHEAHAFWRNLAEGERLFERDRKPPQALACPGPRYGFIDAKGGAMPVGCTRIGGL